MKYNKFLKLGSVIKLKDETKRIMIIGYLQTPKDVNDNSLFDYIGCLYPEGVTSANKTYTFNHDKIEKVYNDPFEDSETKSFLIVLNSIEKQIFQLGANKVKNQTVYNNE